MRWRIMEKWADLLELFWLFSRSLPGIIAIVTRKGEGKGPFVAGGFYLAGGIIGLAMAGSYADLKIWGVACIIFALVFIIGTILEKKRR